MLGLEERRARTEAQGSSTGREQTQAVLRSGEAVLGRRSFLRAFLATAVASALPSQESQAQDTARARPYESTLQKISDKLDRRGNSTRIFSTLLTDEELDTVASAFINGLGAPHYVAQMPERFSAARRTEMENSGYRVPYVNHEGQALREYSVFREQDIFRIQAAARARNLTVDGLTPLDHQKGLYAIAVTQADGTKSWLVGKVVTSFAKSRDHGYGPGPALLHAVLPEFIELLPK